MAGRWVWVWDMIKVRCRKHSREPGLPTLDIYQSIPGPGLCHGDEKMTQTWQTRVRCHADIGYLGPNIFYHRSQKSLRNSVFLNQVSSFEVLNQVSSFEVTQVINCCNILCLMAVLLLCRVPVSSPPMLWPGHHVGIRDHYQDDLHLAPDCERCSATFVMS